MSNETVSILFDANNFVIRVGLINVFPARELNKTLREGGRVETMHIDEYRQKSNTFTWIWDAPKTKKI